MNFRWILALLLLGVVFTTSGCLCQPRGCCPSDPYAVCKHRGGPPVQVEPCASCNPSLPRCCHNNVCYQHQQIVYNLFDSVCALACEQPGMGRQTLGCECGHCNKCR